MIRHRFLSSTSTIWTRAPLPPGAAETPLNLLSALQAEDRALAAVVIGPPYKYWREKTYLCTYISSIATQQFLLA